ncbi:uncharacterized protein K441DRAFT_680682 [Cenococcum geophilum 1.58]|uniref:uncharacterized protein n=1 Tax=Cenococcum geophilum 1.58 TaxID=794803 RepID=UPI00358FB8B0|nr:hypothetical protein K441DRAFT_680682 [Cenococcum geophilum 1.58]
MAKAQNLEMANSRQLHGLNAAAPSWTPQSYTALPQSSIQSWLHDRVNTPGNWERMSSVMPTCITRKSEAGPSSEAAPTDRVTVSSGIAHNAVAPSNLALPKRPHPWVATTAYRDLTGMKVPTWPLAAMYLPFRDLARDLIVPQHGVILIENAPFDIVKNEIVALLGRTAKIVQCPPRSCFHSVHVAYDRNTGKAHNIFVELDRDEDAQEVVRSFADYQAANGYSRRLRNRQIRVTAVGQRELMRAIFPRVRCCEFVGTVPYIIQAKEHESAFQGFLVEEELRSLLRFADKPGKTIFCKDSPQRPYEAMISLLAKYPWQSNDTYKLKERDMLFYYVEKLAQQLLGQIPDHQDGRFQTKLNAQLLTELVVVACSCRGFNSNQQAHLVALTNGFLKMQMRLPRLAFYAPFDCLAIHPRAQEVLVEV